ncbi:MAG: carboxymuconolactone decarboxylase family protein [Nitrospirae bacterium]|nr:carboxymuconolactone decarboxylase family protein [Nitrospirota bacterium]
MNRKQVYADIEATLGVLPGFLKALPDTTLELEWQLMKRSQMEEGPIPNKFRELIGVAMSAVTKCRYCAYYHTEMAKLNGATEAEIEDAIHFAKSSAGWSAYINGMQTDFEQFKREVQTACKHVRQLAHAA